MRSIVLRLLFFATVLSPLALTSCASNGTSGMSSRYGSNYLGSPALPADYSSRIPSKIATNEKTVIVDPRVHAWGAYDGEGNLVKAGVASAGSDYCRDLHRPCHTKVGSFRVYSLGDADCKSHIFPIPRGGAPMPYCMFFNSGQALHGVPPYEVGDGNYSHGCVRLQVGDAEWLRHNFVNVGTRVVIKPYN